MAKIFFSLRPGTSSPIICRVILAFFIFHLLCPSVNISTCPIFEPTSSVILEDLDDLDSEQATSHQFDVATAATPATPTKKQRTIKPK